VDKKRSYTLFLNNLEHQSLATINQRGPYQFQAIVRRKGYPLDVMLFCVRWYVAYALSLRNLEKITIDKSGANTAAVLSMIAEPSSAERDPY